MSTDSVTKGFDMLIEMHNSMADKRVGAGIETMNIALLQMHRNAAKLLQYARALHVSRAARTLHLINELRADVGNYLTIAGDNDDPDRAEHSSSVEVIAAWTNWEARTFRAANVLEALELAAAAARGA